MDTYEKLRNKKSMLAVIGLGYVGLPLAAAFSKKISVIGFDLNKEKIELYKNGIDPTKEVGDKEIKGLDILFTSDEHELTEAEFYIIAVPTPVKNDKTPDLAPVLLASEIVGRNMKKGSIIVYESTVYPGVTEDECVPVLEKESGFKYGKDFKVGYSPERINPCDKEHVLSNIIKVVSAMDQETLEVVAKVYELVALQGVYKASSIKVAEAAKVIENSQRDINIAFMNELSIIFHKIGIETNEVLKAAATKWNFLNFQPGLVGGHCIGVDPYYLAHKAAQLGYHTRIISAGRQINDGMGKYVAENIVKGLIKTNKIIGKAKVALFGFTFKENCQDTRNTKVIDIVNELHDYGIDPIIIDDVADAQEAKRLYGVDIGSIHDMDKVDVISVCVQHDIFKTLGKDIFDTMFLDGNKLLFDIKSIYNRQEFEEAGYYYWNL